MRRGFWFATAVISFAAATPAQDVPGISRIPVTGPIHYARMNLDTGELQVLATPTPAGAGCFTNTVDVDPTVDPACPGSSCLDALLFPPGDELFDWGIKACNGSDFVESIVIGFASTATPVGSGGPGGSLTLRVYERGTGFGVAGTEVLSIALTGLPSDGGAVPLLVPWMLTIDLGAQSFFLPTGPIAWSYENPDGQTAPLLVDVTIANGTQNYFDVYRPGPASAGNYLGTYTLLPGGISNDPLENSFYIVLNENDTVALRSPIAAGSNPNVLSSGRPIVGSSWDPAIDLAGFPTATGTLLALTRQRVTGVMTPFGELIADLSAPLIPLQSQSGGAYSFPLPTDSSIVGLQFFGQGAVLTTAQGLLLTNGLNLTVGTF